MTLNIFNIIWFALVSWPYFYLINQLNSNTSQLYLSYSFGSLEFIACCFNPLEAVFRRGTGCTQY